jgi:hypothetical protein
MIAPISDRAYSGVADLVDLVLDCDLVEGVKRPPLRSHAPASYLELRIEE